MDGWSARCEDCGLHFELAGRENYWMHVLEDHPYSAMASRIRAEIDALIDAMLDDDELLDRHVIRGLG